MIKFLFQKHSNNTHHKLLLWWVFALCFSLLLISCENDPEEVAAFRPKPPSPDEIAVEVSLIYTDSARLKAILEAPLMETYRNRPEPYTEMRQGIFIEFYDREGGVTSSLKADYGIQYDDKDETEVKGNVLVVNEDGDSLTTEQLFWLEEKDLIYSDRAVRVKTAEEIIFSEGFESSSSFQNYKFYKISGILSVDEP